MFVFIIGIGVLLVGIFIRPIVGKIRTSSVRRRSLHFFTNIDNCVRFGIPLGIVLAVIGLIIWIF
jgi:hypothetical protein